MVETPLKLAVVVAALLGRLLPPIFVGLLLVGGVGVGAAAADLDDDDG